MKNVNIKITEYEVETGIFYEIMTNRKYIDYIYKINSNWGYWCGRCYRSEDEDLEVFAFRAFRNFLEATHCYEEITNRFDCDFDITNAVFLDKYEPENIVNLQFLLMDIDI